MTKYYVIPIMESKILIPYRMGKYIPISEYVRKYYPKLADLEEERVSIICSGDYCASYTKKQHEQLQRNAFQKRQVAEQLGIPLYILATKNWGQAYEVETHSKILSDQNESVFLDTREQPKNVYLTYYNGDYIARVKKFFQRKDFIVIQGGAQKMLKR